MDNLVLSVWEGVVGVCGVRRDGAYYTYLNMLKCLNDKSDKQLLVRESYNLLVFRTGKFWRAGSYPFHLFFQV